VFVSKEPIFIVILKKGTYTEALDVVHGDLVAEEVEQSILQHAAVAVPEQERTCQRTNDPLERYE
jgi:hypothetical protein